MAIDARIAANPANPAQAPQAVMAAAAPAPSRLWLLALLAGLLPLVASTLAAVISMNAGIVPSCNPLIEGCTSISRAARVGLANHLFQAVMLPAATLQAIVWPLVVRWLVLRGETGRATRAIAPLGVAAGIALVVYGSFLGTDGAIYRLLRQYGTVVYFGFTCLNLLLAGRAVERLVRRGVLVLPAWQTHAMGVLAVVVVLLGIVNAVLSAFVGEPLKDRIQNVTEWWGGAIFVLGFVALALLWRRERVGLDVVVPRG